MRWHGRWLFHDESGKIGADYLRAVAPSQVQAKWSNEA